MTLSKFLRRTHMYLALFLGPWMLGYALSTLIMNHRLTAPQTFALEREEHYETAFPPGTAPRDQAIAILSYLDLVGAFGVQGPAADGRLTINRQDILTPRRIVYTPSNGRLTVEKVAFRTTTFLNRFHHRRGYQQPFVADWLMAASVDLTMGAMLFWAFSGVWMWWEMKATRTWGLAFVVAGAAVFAYLAATL